MFKKILSLLMIVSFLLTGVSAFADTELTNLAAGKTVTVSGGTGAATLLTDGVLKNQSSTTWNNGTGGVYAVIDLGTVQEFNTLKVYEYASGGPRLTGYKIEVSNDNSEWSTVIESETEQTFAVNTEVASRYLGTLSFTSQNAQYVKFTVKSSSNKFYIQEIEIYNDPDAVITVPPVDDGTSDETIVDDSVNYARGKTATISNPGSYGGPNFVTDGNKSVSTRNNTWWVTAGSSIVIDLGKEKEIDCVMVYEFQNMRAKKYSLMLSSDNETWKTVIAMDDWLAAAGGAASDQHYYGKLEFEKQPARYVKFQIDELLDVATENIAANTYIEEIEVFDKSNMPNTDDEIDNVLPAPVVVENIPHSKENFHIYLCIGQSNMNGRDEIPLEDYVVLDNAYILNFDDKWEKAQPYPYGSDSRYQGYNRYTSVETNSFNGMNPATSFARAVTEVINNNIGIGIISNARGGTSIEKWQKGSGENLYEEAVRRTKAAIANGGTLKGILWLQGESCASKAGYLDKLNTMVTNMRNEIGVNAADVPFIASEIIQTRPAGNDTIRKIAEKVENSDYVSSKGTATIDNLHYDAESQRLIGIRYAQKILDKVYNISMTEEELHNIVYSPDSPVTGFDDKNVVFTGKAENDNPLKVVNHLNETVDIVGNYITLASRFNITESNYTLEEYGFAVSNDNIDYSKKLQGLVKKEINGSSYTAAFGILAYNLSPNIKYYFKPYAIYKDSEGNLYYKYGNDITEHQISE